MLAGGLMHEGMHAGMDDALVARVQAEFNAGRRAVQWDEMRAFMAEIGYHGSFCRWAADDIAGQWRQIEGLLGELEKLRKKPALRAEADEVRFEQTRTRAWTFAALVRLRMREIWQSARRMQDLSESFRKDYVRDTPPPDVEELLSKLEHDAAGFVAASEKVHPGDRARRPVPRRRSGYVGRLGVGPPALPSSGHGLAGDLQAGQGHRLAGSSPGRGRGGRAHEEGGRGAREGAGFLVSRPSRPQVFSAAR